MTDHETFKARVEAFLRNTGMSERQFGKEACNDTAFVGDLRNGMEPRSPRRNRVEAFMKSYRIPGATGPAAEPATSNGRAA